MQQHILRHQCSQDFTLCLLWQTSKPTYGFFRFRQPKRALLFLYKTQPPVLARAGSRLSITAKQAPTGDCSQSSRTERSAGQGVQQRGGCRGRRAPTQPPSPLAPSNALTPSPARSLSKPEPPLRTRGRAARAAHAWSKTRPTVPPRVPTHPGGRVPRREASRDGRGGCEAAAAAEEEEEEGVGRERGAATRPAGPARAPAAAAAAAGRRLPAWRWGRDGERGLLLGLEGAAHMPGAGRWGTEENGRGQLPRGGGSRGPASAARGAHGGGGGPGQRQPAAKCRRPKVKGQAAEAPPRA